MQVPTAILRSESYERCRDFRRRKASTGGVHSGLTPDSFTICVTFSF